MSESSGAEAAKAAFRDYYMELGRERIGKRVVYFANKVGMSTAKVDVRDLGNRWASWSPNGCPASHCKCLMAPLSIIDYIVVHE